ncbi:MAG: PAS domain S-box protein, partial [Candidatus Brocadiales bacterium]|nr:PAS domain S-box protein [Candidatus Brocadiales bacterium]
MAKAQILIVEDEITITESLQEILKNKGYGVAGAVSSGEEAIQKALKMHPDLVLMDIKLEGDIDGVEAARQIHKSLDIPIIYLTGYADNDLLERVKRTGPYGYISKPFVAKDLSIVIEMALYKHKTERELKELNESLEQRITERTAELEIVNEKLKREVKERRKIEKTLKESEEKFRMISDAAHDAIVMVDENGDISYWNKAAERIFAYPSDMVIGKRMLELIMPKKLREVYSSELECFNAIGKGHFVGKTIEFTAARKDGTEFVIELSLSSVKINNKWNAIGILRDVTERRQIEKEFMEAYKMASIGRLTSGVFHEILNPL